jgi:hypothetical protein
MGLLRIGKLPDSATAAAAAFHAEFLGKVQADTGAVVTLIFAPADYTHRAWRLAAVQGLAREYAPRRINAVVSDDAVAIATAVSFLEGAAGVTGQLLQLDSAGNSAGAGEVVSPAP